MSKLVLILIATLTAAGALAEKGEEIPCTRTYHPADASYDFTAAIDRWGQKKVRYDFDGNETVGHIYINSLPIFDTGDPKEDNFLYRWINRIHPKTHPYVFRQLILMKEGGPVNNHLIEESERILREQKFSSDASIRAVSDCNNVVDLEVITKEVWTLLPEVSAGTAGGKTQSSLGLHDSNFLGTGSLITLSYAHNIDRDSVLVHYQNNNLRGSRIRLLTHLEENTDGYVRRIQVDLPFYELNAKHTWGVVAAQSKQADHQYYRGDTVTQVDTEREFLQLWGGNSPGLKDNTANRFIYGVIYDRARFDPLAGIPTPAPMPDDRTLVYPYFEFQQIQNQYTVAYNINQINREEDIHIGRSLWARFGFSRVDAPRLIFAGGVSDTFISRDKELFQGTFDWHGRWNFDENRTEDTHVSVLLDYHHGQTSARSLHFSLKLVDTWNRSPEQQIILGGDTGLRGYPVHYATGDMSYLFTAEQQIFTHYSVFSLYNVGFVGFVDAGRAFYKGNRGVDDGVLTDAGFGVRFVPTKTDKDHVVHLDIGWPLKKVPGARGAQLIIQVQKTI
ncbi:MAG TPA: hypothetical protein VJ998_04250 [Pseudomonadales bacterium]|nr:hypothetical protein [Pseudomonadales bacterium]